LIGLGGGLSGGRRLGHLGRDLAAQARDERLDNLSVSRRQFRWLGRCRAGLLLDLLHHVEEHLDRTPIGLGRFVDHLDDDRLALGDLAPLAVDRDVDRLVECGDQQRREILAARPARVPGLALLERPAARRLAVADFLVSFRFGHDASWFPEGAMHAEFRKL
jgi:hypothetical protein